MTIIDAHTLFGFWPQRKADISAETLVGLLKHHQVSGCVTFSTTGIFADYRQGNDETLELSGKARGLYPVGTVDPRRFVGTLEEIDERMKQGVRLWRLFPEYQGWDLDIQPVTAILHRLAEKGASLMMAAGAAGLPSAIAARTAGLNMKTVLLGVTVTQLGELISLLRAHDHLLLETRRLTDPQVVGALVAQFGADRLVFGSAAPLQYVSSALLPLQSAQMTERQRERVMSGNISALANA